MDNKSLTFKQFLKKNWLIFVCLGIFPIIVLATFVVIMIFGKCDITDLGSMLGGFLAYCGTILLGAVTVWQVERQRQENFLMIEEQNYQTNKGSLQIYIEVIYNNVVLVIKNMGKSEIYNGSITFDENWIKQLDNFGVIATQFKKSLLKSITSNIYLAANQEIRFLLHYVQTDDEYYKFLTGEDCCVAICYETLGRAVEQKLTLNFHSVLASYYGLNIEEESVNSIERIYKNQIEEIKNINANIKTLNTNIGSINRQLEGLSKKIK